ncbi:MAG: hypothetical protein A3G32_05220 [Deltaproteobacteria bacterium RIFCSPLOWO2_12_FULL_40_28]|nr:MAG: hypothetical protein A3C45_09330 [Deltaproteobacteria bacterium RIFCSPHIGHO2_02_FULL_40_28]OGQ19762.1 MAG: hypothetical protein A3E27_08525 [Deltaproteobacteria bacterium RIFCSPHIGHO2_12_FULL_40_32]OGQ41039.1 MAG: hypothetical protein A3I69_03940 [Deltaproteobacteria bacterium RIFCSPLOWO2_02_FULL_40_36]OGQ54155.1 MAG: hypothetical protein A3G32_05220 [Deltaproteobacteria bacterium RIFCSPLOWO2_12_FULL_40_28]
MEKPIIFVAGASSFTGQYLVKELTHRGFETISHIRPDSPKKNYWIEFFKSLKSKTDLTPWDGDLMTKTMQTLSPSHVFCLIGTTQKRIRVSQKKHFPESYESVDVGLTKLLIRSCNDANKKPVFIYLSSLGAKANATGSYLKARNQAEQSIQKSDLPYLIVRAPIIYGKERGERRYLEEALAQTLRGFFWIGKKVGLEKWTTHFEPIRGKILAQALANLIEEKLRNQIVYPKDFIS